MTTFQKLVAMTILTFIALFAVGHFSHNADPTGSKTGVAADTTVIPGGQAKIPVSQVGLNKLSDETGHLAVSINFVWLLMTGFLVLFMQVGFAFLVTGLTRAKNAGHMMMMNLSSFVIALLAYYAVGFAFQFGGVAPIANLGGTSPLNGIFAHGNAGLIGTHAFFLQSGNSYDVGVIAFFLFQVVFMETAGYIIIGAIAERVSFAGFILAEIAMGAIIYPIYGNWMWGGGWLSHLGTGALKLGNGAVDFAGSGVVHATGGWAALALAMVLGPRIGKYRKDGTPNAFPGHNLGYAVIGTLVLTFGWMGFNPGSTFGATDLRIAIVAVNTLLAASAGAVVAMAWTNAKWGKPDISMTCNGMLAGLVAITAPCAFVSPAGAVVTGVIAGFVVCYAVEFVDKRLKVDDPCGAISVHGFCGAWGLLAVGLFADGSYPAKSVGWNGVLQPVKGVIPAIFNGQSLTGANGPLGQLGAQCIDIVVGFIWAWGTAWLLFMIARRFMKIRVSPEVEIAGTDEGEFGQVCYPDFVLRTETHAPIPEEMPIGTASGPAPGQLPATSSTT
ncbi:MAG TPA: ammonium transporter [Acidimicrobiia bacterium]|nr:ammonium transporter [Acidimicrobiia bacterium]